MEPGDLDLIGLDIGPAMEEAAVINPADLELEATVLGRGAWGVVRCGTLHGHPVAVKMLPDATPEEEATALAREIRLMAVATAVRTVNELTTARHQKMALTRVLAYHAQRCTGVCRLLGTCVKDARTCVIMRRYERTLADMLSEHGAALPVPRVLECAHQDCSLDPLPMASAVAIRALPTLAAVAGSGCSSRAQSPNSMRARLLSAI